MIAITDRLAFKPSAAADIAGVSVEEIHAAIAAGLLTPRYIGTACVIRRDDLKAWIDANLPEDDSCAEGPDKDELIRHLQIRINELEHQIMADDPFLPGAVLKKHAACLASPPATQRQEKHLYFMRCGNYIKIGVSQDPQRRLTQIRGGSSLIPVGMDYRQAELVRVVPGAGNREYPTHWKFAHLRHTGEWFTETPELTDYIRNIERSAA